MRLAAPTILLIHWVGLLCYFTITKDPAQWAEYKWSVFYFSINNITIINYCLMYAKFPKCEIANQFVYIDIFFTFILMMCTVLHYGKWITSTYGLKISILGMIFTTILIVFNGYKYGIFKK